MPLQTCLRSELLHPIDHVVCLFFPWTFSKSTMLLLNWVENCRQHLQVAKGRQMAAASPSLLGHLGCLFLSCVWSFANAPLPLFRACQLSIDRKQLLAVGDGSSSVMLAGYIMNKLKGGSAWYLATFQNIQRVPNVVGSESCSLQVHKQRF